MIRRTSVTVCAALTLLPVLTGCSGDDSVTLSSSCLVKGAPVTLVVGVHSNSPNPKFSDDVSELAAAAADAGKKITIVRIDGAPKEIYSKTFMPTAKNDTARKRQRQKFLSDLTAVLLHTAPNTPPEQDIRAQVAESDVLGALGTAARTTPKGGNIVLIDSGLQTVAPLDFRDGILEYEDPTPVVDVMEDSGQLPDLKGKQVVLAGLGSIAPPQDGLDNRLHARVSRLWKSIAERAKAGCVGEEPQENPKSAVPNLPKVSTIRLPPPEKPNSPQNPCDPQVLDDRRGVGFKKDLAEFRDRAKARSVLTEFAANARTPGSNVVLTGATSSEGSTEHNQTLSEQRAQAVRDVLVELKVPENAIVARGVGENLPGRETDMNADGTLRIGPAVRNRKVVAELKGTVCR